MIFFKDKYDNTVVKICESVILLLSLFPLTKYSYELALLYCDKMGVGLDYSISMVGGGIGYNMIFVLSILGVTTLVWIIEKGIPKLIDLLF